MYCVVRRVTAEPQLLIVVRPTSWLAELALLPQSAVRSPARSGCFSRAPSATSWGVTCWEQVFPSLLRRAQERGVAIADPLVLPEHPHRVGIPLVLRLVLEGDWVANRDPKRHLLGRVIELVRQEGGEDLAAALLLALLPSGLPLSAA